MDDHDMRALGDKIITQMKESGEPPPEMIAQLVTETIVNVNRIAKALEVIAGHARQA